MKCKWINEVGTEISRLEPAEAAKVVTRKERNHVTGEMVDRYYWPAGSIHEHPEAYKFVDFGMATPADEECEKMCKPMSPAERHQLEMNYRADSLGITDEEDRKLFFDGVILGYQKIGETITFIPGPAYPAWKEQQSALRKQEEDDV